MSTKLRIDQPLASTLDSRLRAQPRAPEAAPAEACNTHLRARGQIGSHCARKLQNVRKRGRRCCTVHERAQDWDDAEDRIDASQLAPDIEPVDGSAEDMHGLHERDGGRSTGDDVGDDDFEACLRGVSVGEELVVDEAEAEGVGEEEDGGGRSRGWWGGGYIALFAVEGLFFARRGAVIVDATFEAIRARHCGRVGARCLRSFYSRHGEGRF